MVFIPIRPTVLKKLYRPNLSDKEFLVVHTYRYSGVKL
jgi:hypothetical protein